MLISFAPRNAEKVSVACNGKQEGLAMDNRAVVTSFKIITEVIKEGSEWRPNFIAYVYVVKDGKEEPFVAQDSTLVGALKSVLHKALPLAKEMVVRPTPEFMAPVLWELVESHVEAANGG